MNQHGTKCLTLSRSSGTTLEQSEIAGQIEKEVYHNEALALVDLLVAGVLEAGPIAAPPASPVIGALYLVTASDATGAFAGMDGRLAGWTAGGWRFVAPVEGVRLTLQSSGVDFQFWNGAWRSGSLRADELVIFGDKVVGSAGAAIADPAEGTGIDANARACIGQILAALRGHGLILS